MEIKAIIEVLERFAPPGLQENYDNAGLITGNKNDECTGILISLDTTEAVLDEAIEQHCNLIISHHPIVFTGLKKITGSSYVERTIIKAIKNDIAIYAIHTNLDNVHNGVNKKIADVLGLENTRVLATKGNLLRKFIVFVPQSAGDKVRDALFAAGAGNFINYSECSFNTNGEGTFLASQEANPYVGQKGLRHKEEELKIELLYPSYLEDKLISEMIKAHPYEQPAYDVILLGNKAQEAGSGVIGELPQAISPSEFLEKLKTGFNAAGIRHTGLPEKNIKKVALCGGAGIFLLPNAKAAGADAYVTADVKYHEFFDADGSILLADIGHYESEQHTIALLFDILRENFPNFAVLKTGVNTNPVRYYS